MYVIQGLKMPVNFLCKVVIHKTFSKKSTNQKPRSRFFTKGVLIERNQYQNLLTPGRHSNDSLVCILTAPKNVTPT
jgi:hypothetical protein